MIVATLQREDMTLPVLTILTSNSAVLMKCSGSFSETRIRLRLFSAIRIPLRLSLEATIRLKHSLPVQVFAFDTVSSKISLVENICILLFESLSCLIVNIRSCTRQYTKSPETLVSSKR